MSPSVNEKMREACNIGDYRLPNAMNTSSPQNADKWSQLRREISKTDELPTGEKFPLK